MQRLVFLLALTACATAAPAVSQKKTSSKQICSNTAPPMFPNSDKCAIFAGKSEKSEPLDEKLLFEEDIEGVVEAGDTSIDIVQKLSALAKNAVAASRKLWPGGYVYYQISDDFNEAERKIIDNAAKAFEQTDAVRIYPRSGQRDYVNVVRESTSCSSKVGRTFFAQRLNLGTGCMKLGTVMHEFNHAIGFWHEQSRHDRDDYIELNKDNIQQDKMHNFVIHGLNEATVSGTEYDLDSIMHYGRYAFAVNKNVWSIRPKPPNEYEDIGQRAGFSVTDLKEINTLYPLCAVMWTDKYTGESLTFVKNFETTLHADWHDKLSSAKVTKGCTLSLYSLEDFLGDVQYYDGEGEFDFAELRMDNTARSAKCRCG